MSAILVQIGTVPEQQRYWCRVSAIVRACQSPATLFYHARRSREVKAGVYPAPPERAGVGSIPANPDAPNVPSFRRWRFEMKLGPFFTSAMCSGRVHCCERRDPLFIKTEKGLFAEVSTDLVEVSTKGLYRKTPRDRWRRASDSARRAGGVLHDNSPDGTPDAHPPHLPHVPSERGRGTSPPRPLGKGPNPDSAGSRSVTVAGRPCLGPRPRHADGPAQAQRPHARSQNPVTQARRARPCVAPTQTVSTA